MPEGDTVWLAGQRLHDALAGDVLVRSDLPVPSLATVDLAGQTVVEVVPRGKHLLTRLSGGLTLHTHFRMDGSWHLYRPGDRWTGGPQWQVRAVLETASWQAVGYRLPVVGLLASSDEDSVVGHLGPDVLGPDWDRDLAVERLLAEPDAEVGMALLDQRNLAGLGNLYRCEVLFLQGLTPWVRVADVRDLPALVATRVGGCCWRTADGGSSRRPAPCGTARCTGCSSAAAGRAAGAGHGSSPPSRGQPCTRG